jgi:hypothetical protein
LVAWLAAADLLLGAKHLLVEAIALKSHHDRARGDPTASLPA